MATTIYDTVNGLLISESNAGAVTTLLADELGSVQATARADAIVNAYRYSPLGTLLSKTGSAADPRFLWIGGFAYQTTSRSFSEQYVRARHYTVATGRWATRDPIWPWQPPYAYANGNPILYVDPSGQTPLYFQACAFIGGWRADPLFRPFMHLFSGLAFYPVPVGINTNDRGFFEDPLKCKIFVEAMIDSCDLGRAAPSYEYSAGVSKIAWLIIPHHPWVWFTGQGKIDVLATGSARGCSSWLNVSARGYAAAPIIGHLPKPIQLDFTVYFFGSKNNVNIAWNVTNRTMFPDFEFRVGVAGQTYKWGVQSPYAGPELGLAVTASGPGEIVSAYPVPTPQCCGGGCG